MKDLATHAGCECVVLSRASEEQEEESSKVLRDVRERLGGVVGLGGVVCVWEGGGGGSCLFDRSC